MIPHVLPIGLSATWSYIHSPSLILHSPFTHTELARIYVTPAPRYRSLTQVFPINNLLYVGLPGFATDTYTLREHLRFRVNMYRMKEEREITPKTFAHLLSSTLYEKRWVRGRSR